MNRILAGKLLLTFVLVGGAIMSFALDWSANHLLNPLWHPHARYHSAILLFLFAGVAATATWNLWRRLAGDLRGIHHCGASVSVLLDSVFLCSSFVTASLILGRHSRSRTPDRRSHHLPESSRSRIIRGTHRSRLVARPAHSSGQRDHASRQSVIITTAAAATTIPHPCRRVGRSRKVHAASRIVDAG